MLLRDRQFRVKVNQLIDGCLFALGLWLAWAIRSYWTQFGPKGVDAIFGDRVADAIFRHREVDPIAPFADYLWLFLVVIPMAPLVVEWQGFYERSIFASVKHMAWQLAKACAISVVGLMVIDVMLKREAARAVFVLFGFCSFGLVFLKEEIVRVAFKTKLAQAKFKRRIILVGAAADTRRLLADMGERLEEL